MRGKLTEIKNVKLVFRKIFIFYLVEKKCHKKFFVFENDSIFKSFLKNEWILCSQAHIYTNIFTHAHSSSSRCLCIEFLCIGIGLDLVRCSVKNKTCFLLKVSFNRSWYEEKDRYVIYKYNTVKQKAFNQSRFDVLRLKFDRNWKL